MLADTLIRTPRTPGLSVIQPAGAHGARELAGWRIHLAPGQSVTHSRPGEEMVVVLQEGRGRFLAAGTTFAVSRLSVFTERASALYLPPGVAVTIEADTPLEAIAIATPVAGSQTPGADQPVLIGPDQIEPLPRGRGTYARHVHNLFVTDSHARRLMVGETFNAPGHWSSFPPHKHDGRNGEPKLEEVYHFRVDPPRGSGSRSSTRATAKR